jgi:UDP-glucose 4-epimerase
MIAAARGEQPAFEITGTNWTTRDGTGIRDYVHVWDLAQAHLLAVTQFDDVFAKQQDERYCVMNLGTGDGVTVKELLAAFERVYGQPIPKIEKPPRPGDVAGAYANLDKARRLLGWEPRLSIDQAISDALKWAEVRTKILKYD